VLHEGRVDVESIKAFCRGRSRTTKCRATCFVAEFPMTVTGKMQKFKMRDISA
jgi:fatty-acyl-CoA synthase